MLKAIFISPNKKQYKERTSIAHRVSPHAALSFFLMSLVWLMPGAAPWDSVSGILNAQSSANSPANPPSNRPANTPSKKGTVQDRAKVDRKALIDFIDSMSPGKVASVKIQYALLTPGPTVTTAFGHSAVRILSGKNGSDNDYFVDFGRYNESALFLWRFFRGHARFNTHVERTRTAIPGIERFGRGIIVFDLKLDAAQKVRLLGLIKKTLHETRDGYEYNNYTRNCVTYVRDVVGGAIGKPIALKLDAIETHTWRARVLPFSNRNVWLRINEKLLFDHDTDKARKPEELVFLPYDLRFALDKMGLLEKPKWLLPDRWRIGAQASADWVGYGAYLLMLVIIVLMLPIAKVAGKRRWALRLFGFMSAFGGLIAFAVWVFTAFDFMNETLMWLVFFPTDILLWRKSFAPGLEESRPVFMGKSLPFLYGAVRLFMVVVALLLALTVYRQSMLTSVFFSLTFYSLYIYHHWRNSNVPRTANS